MSQLLLAVARELLDHAASVDACNVLAVRCRQINGFRRETAHEEAWGGRSLGCLQANTVVILERKHARDLAPVVEPHETLLVELVRRADGVNIHHCLGERDAVDVSHSDGLGLLVDEEGVDFDLEACEALDARSQAFDMLFACLAAVVAHQSVGEVVADDIEFAVVEAVEVLAQAGTNVDLDAFAVAVPSLGRGTSALADGNAGGVSGSSFFDFWDFGRLELGGLGRSEKGLVREARSSVLVHRDRIHLHHDIFRWGCSKGLVICLIDCDESMCCLERMSFVAISMGVDGFGEMMGLWKQGSTRGREVSSFSA